jgi:peptidoglycan lytic transglycosylase
VHSLIRAIAVVLAMGLVACGSSGKTTKRPGGGSYSTQRGYASYYHEPQRTASGERFDKNAMTAAHRSLPFNTHVRVTNMRNGKTVVVRINDRGPYSGNRIIDLSLAAAKQIDMIAAGVVPVTLEVIK